MQDVPLGHDRFQQFPCEESHAALLPTAGSESFVAARKCAYLLKRRTARAFLHCSYRQSSRSRKPTLGCARLTTPGVDELYSGTPLDILAQSSLLFCVS